jgi:hypothetical protein
LILRIYLKSISKILISREEYLIASYQLGSFLQGHLHFIQPEFGVQIAVSLQIL